ncbi:hypothetical protein OESDEN_14930, partial [Oesophagostomum dentatum]
LQHRSYLRLTEQPFVSLPADVLAQTIISLVALIYGATHVAGAFQHIKSDPLVRTRDKDNYQAILTMPKANRPELIALLAFNIEVAMVREKINPQRGDTSGLYRLQFWRDAINSIYGESTAPVPRQPVAVALCAFAPKASLSLLDSLVVARQQSIGDRPYSTVDDLSAYGKSTEGALVCLQAESLARECAVMKPSEEVVKAANELGAAYGIMNLIRSSLPLMARGIVLLPTDLLALHNLTADKVYNRKNPEAVAALVKDLTQVNFAVLFQSCFSNDFLALGRTFFSDRVHFFFLHFVYVFIPFYVPVFC